jgi:hypothetical protein
VIPVPKHRRFAIILLVGFVLSHLHALGLHARPCPLQERTGGYEEEAALQPATAPEIITVPDGTPLTLKLEKDLSSATARVGDAVEFMTPFPTRINGLVIVPKGTPVSGTVVQIIAARRASRDGEIKIAIGNLNLPTGETVALRQALKSEGTGKKIGTVAAMSPAIAAGSLFDPFIIPGLLIEKGNERVYRAGRWTTVYLVGPLRLNRGALVTLQPPPYEGPAQVFLKNRTGKSVQLYVGQDYVGELYYPVRLEIEPGTYEFNTGDSRNQALKLEVQENQQYWVEREHGELIAGDAQQHRDEIEELQDAPWVTHRNFALQTPAYQGPAQVNFVNRDSSTKIFCGHTNLGEFGGAPLRIELNPGTYSFSASKANGQGLQIPVQEDHQYWIEIKRRKLFVKDFQHLHDDIDQRRWPILDVELRSSPARTSCVPTTPH